MNVYLFMIRKMAKPTPKNPLWKQRKPKRDDPAVLGKLEQAFALDCTIKEACYYAGIHPDTYFELVKDRPELADRFDALREKPVLLARQEVVNWLKGNPEFSLKYLERKRRKEFALRIEEETKETKEINLNINVKDMSVEELEKIRKDLLNN